MKQNPPEPESTTKDFCQKHPNHPKCLNAVPINDDIYILIFLAVFLSAFYLVKRKIIVNFVKNLKT